MTELIKNYVKTSKLIPTEKLSLSFENDFTIPDNAPEIGRITASDAKVIIDKISYDSDRVTIDITINYNVIYMTSGENPEIHAIELKSPQIIIVNSLGIDEDCTCIANCNIEQLEVLLSTGRRLTLKSIVSCDTHMEKVSELAVPIGIDGIADIQTQENPYTLSSTVENVADILDISENAELPLGKSAFCKILKNDAAISDVSFTVGSNELNIKGNLNVCTLYVSEDTTRPLQVIENQLPFTETIFIENDNDSVIWNVNTQLSLFEAEAIEDPDGELRILKITAAIKIDATAHETVSGDILSDAYSLSQVFTLPTQTVDIYTKCGELSSQFVLKTIASVPEDLPQISEAVNINGQICHADIKTENGGAVIEGVVLCNIIYISKDSDYPIASFTEQIPFTQRIDRRDITDATVATANIIVNHTSFSILSPNEMELRIAITTQGELLTPGKITVITDVCDVSDYNPNLENQPSILLYIVQPCDTLWKIAKRYNAPLDILISINDIENPDLIYPGQKLLIPKG